MTILQFDAWRAGVEVRMLISILVLALVIHLARASWKHHHQDSWWTVKAHQLSAANRQLNRLFFAQLSLLAFVAIATLVAVWMSVAIMLLLGGLAVGALMLFFWFDVVRTSRWSDAKTTRTATYRDTQVG